MDLRVTAHGTRFASVGQKIVVEVDAGVLTLRAPFYRRSIPLRDIVSAEVQPDDGLNHGLVNWFVVGSARSAQGVRLSTGGRARVDLVTADGRRYSVVLDTLDQARQVADAVGPRPADQG